MEEVSVGTVILFSLLILFSFVFFVLLSWIGWRFSERKQSVCPYTGVPLRRTAEISYYSTEKILHFLHDFHQYDNRVFKLSKSAFCRETGRIFQDCITIFDTIKVDWNFLQKRYPGNWISWGSLSEELQNEIKGMHGPLDAFQTIHSSPIQSPKAIPPEYAYTRPGPLYVDLTTKILLGWQRVPDTEFEVLIVQKPLKIIYS